MGMFTKKEEQVTVEEKGFFENVQEDDVDVFDMTIADPEELAESYINAVLECENEEEVSEVMLEFFEAVSAYTIQEIYVADVKAKIEALKLIRKAYETE